MFGEDRKGKWFVFMFINIFSMGMQLYLKAHKNNQREFNDGKIM